MAKAVNDLGGRAKAGKLRPDDTQRNLYCYKCRTFGSVFGTPILNQPQVGILASAIRKVPAVIETPEGDLSEYVKKCSFLTVTIIVL
jgi:2-oxoglutarate dehydrogenase E2 component (dihydrolipoamide succinyltransferase)